MNELQKILDERGARYGDFTNNAQIAQALKNSVHAAIGWDKLSAVHMEGLEQILAKISRIVTGDPDYKDNWDDIAGYAKIVSDRCKNENRDRPVTKSSFDKGITGNSA